jgi:creatinine amidohydrolase
MSSRLLLHELTREEAKAVAGDTLVVFPVGATEQHGPHLPVGTDFLTIEYVARAAATEAAQNIPVMVTPTMPFGSSHHHLPFGMTMSLSTDACHRALYELTESLIISGFRSIFILNGHGGNHEVIQIVARYPALKYPVHLAAASYWTVAWDALVKLEAHTFGRLPGHSGAYETSQMMALRPDLIREPRPHRDGVTATDPRGFERPYRAEHHGFWQSIDGYTDSPDRADPDRGKAYLAAVVRSIAKVLLDFYTTTRSKS